MASDRKKDSVVDEELKKLGRHVAKIRLTQEEKMSQEKLAELAGLNTAQISRIETGAINATVKTILAICKGLKMTPEEFFKGFELPNGKGK